MRDLGVHYDTLLKMETHVKSVCKKAYYQIHLIHKVRRYISEHSARRLVQTNVTSLLDYCNSLLIGLPDTLLSKLQRVQNCAARVVKQAPRSTHTTPLLKELHWLPIKYRIDYKVLIITFKALNGLSPNYISDLLHPYEPARTLRSRNSKLLSPQPFKCKTYGGRAFTVAAPSLWNDIPLSLRSITEMEAFKKALKTHFYRLAFK